MAILQLTRSKADMTKVFSIVLAFVTCTASAQYKCVDTNGKVAFQQMPCSAAEKEQKIRVFPSEAAKQVPPSTAPSQPALTPDQRLLANIERERRLEEKARTIDYLQGQVAYLEEVIARRNVQMSSEIAVLQSKKGYSKNNLAGATWEQSISVEMQAVAQKYKTMNDIDLDRLRQLRTNLEAARTAK